MPQYIEDELWGLHLAPHKTYSQEVEMPFRVTMAALDAKLESQSRSSVFVRVDDVEYVLCSLTPGLIEQQPLNHIFVLGEKITFYTNGENAIHLTGNFLTLDEELEEGYPIDLDAASDEDEADSEIDEEITSEEDDGESECSDADFHSEDEDEPKIKELSAEEEKQLVADVNKKIKELKSKESSLKSKNDDDEEDDDDISVDEEMSFDDDNEDEDSEGSEFDSEFDEEDFDEDDSEEDDDESDMESNKKRPVVSNNKRAGSKSQIPEPKKQKMDVKTTFKNETPKQVAAAAQAKTATPKPAVAQAVKTETPKPAAQATKTETPKPVAQVTKTETPKPAAQATKTEMPKPVAQVTKTETPKPVAQPAKTTETPTAKGNQAADANQKAPESGKLVSKTLPSGLKIEDLKVGEGMKVKSGRKVAIVYKGTLLNGKVFDSNKPANPLEFQVGRGDVVKGLEMGVQGMALNGVRRITIPAPLAYGAKELPGIPKNSTLVFDVTIQSVSGK